VAATRGDDRIELADDLVEQAAFAARDGRWPAALAAADEAVRVLREQLDAG
jgi:hypothetical protein